jgi:hypothetical protein
MYTPLWLLPKRGYSSFNLLYAEIFGPLLGLRRGLEFIDLLGEDSATLLFATQVCVKSIVDFHASIWLMYANCGYCDNCVHVACDTVDSINWIQVCWFSEIWHIGQGTHRSPAVSWYMLRHGASLTRQHHSNQLFKLPPLLISVSKVN